MCARVHVNVHVHAHRCRSVHVEVRGNLVGVCSLLPSRGSWGLYLGSQPWHQAFTVALSLRKRLTDQANNRNLIVFLNNCRSLENWKEVRREAFRPFLGGFWMICPKENLLWQKEAMPVILWALELTAGSQAGPVYVFFLGQKDDHYRLKCPLVCGIHSLSCKHSKGVDIWNSCQTFVDLVWSLHALSPEFATSVLSLYFMNVVIRDQTYLNSFSTCQAQSRWSHLCQIILGVARSKFCPSSVTVKS